MSSFSGLFGGGGGAGGYAAPHPGYKTGRYYQPMPTANGADVTVLSSAPTANTLFFVPIYLFYDVTIAALVTENTGTGDSGKVIRLGIYGNDFGQPGSLEFAGAVLTLGATATRNEVTVNQAFTKGWHYIAYVSSTAPALRTFDPGGNLPKASWGLRSAATSAQVAGNINPVLSVAFAYAALPSTAPALTAVSNDTPFFSIKIG